jgi:hypothetical protein
MVVRLDSLSRASQNMKMSMPAQYTSESMPVSTVIGQTLHYTLSLTWPRLSQTDVSRGLRDVHDQTVC